MSNDYDDSGSYQPCKFPEQSKLIIASTLHLMSHYTANSQNPEACPRLASAIERHLRCLADMPGLSPVLQRTCQQLYNHWQQRMEQTMQAPQKVSIFRRMMFGIRTA